MNQLRTTKKPASQAALPSPPLSRPKRLLEPCVAALTIGCLTLLTACGSSINPNAVPPLAPPSGSNVLTAQEVGLIVQAAAQSVNVPLTISVSDRRGVILAVYNKAGAPATAIANFSVVAPAQDVAAALARTAAFFSNNQAPIGSRTVRFLSGIHFPPNVFNSESAPLYGIENTNRGCGFNTVGDSSYLPGQSFPKATSLSSPNTPGLGILTGKANLYDSDPNAVNPGGVPIFKNNQVAGAIGVVADPATPDYNAVVEYVGYVGAVTNPLLPTSDKDNKFGPTVPDPGAVVVGGVTLPFVNQTTLPAGLTTGAFDGSYAALPPDSNAPAGAPGPIDSPGPAPELDLIKEHASPSSAGLTLAQVQQIVQNAVTVGNQTRAAIRLPVGARARFVIAVSDLDGSLLALYRMPDATIFSVDVAVAKSRNVIWFSGPNGFNDLPGVPQGTAVTNRTLDFAGQPLYPEGIENTQPGPFFPLFLNDVAHPCTQGSQQASPNQSGIVFFPGSTPLFVDGKLVGGLGVSGDGVDQDDFVTAGGAKGFEAPTAIRADNYYDRGVRLTYQKFPADPTL